MDGTVSRGVGQRGDLWRSGQNAGVLRCAQNDKREKAKADSSAALRNDKRVAWWTRNQWTRWRRAISFSARGSPDSVQRRRPEMPQFFSTSRVKARSFRSEEHTSELQ